MLMDFLNQFGLILGIAVAVVGGGVVIYGQFRTGRQNYIIRDNEELRKSNADRDTKIAGLEATVTSQAIQITDLQKVATQTPEVKLLIQATTQQQKLVTKQHAEVIAQLSQLTKKLAEVAKAMTVNTASQDANTASREK